MNWLNIWDAQSLYWRKHRPTAQASVNTASTACFEAAFATMNM